ncbi:MAG: hypothetical protein KKE39_10145, partial [Bacteroidetes bacterium]|nr:hypothetical protein [Bacteroidota bacterium]
MDKPIHPYDSPENINNYLKKIKGLKLEKVNYRSLVEDLENKLGMIPFTGISIKKGTELYRARKNPAFNDKMFETINELTIREDSDILSFGRANLPNKAIFYCSLDQLTAAREVTQWQIDDMGTLIKKGVTFPNYNPFTQFMTISKWVTTKDMYFITLTDEESNLGNSMIQYAKSRYHFDSDRYQKSQR